VVVEREHRARLHPQHRGGDAGLGGDVDRPRKERVADDARHWPPRRGLAREQLGERRPPGRLEVPHEVVLLVTVVVEELEPDASAAHAHAAGRHGRRRGGGGREAGADAGGGAAGDEEALGCEALGEAERRVQVALAREADEDYVGRCGRRGGGR